MVGSYESTKWFSTNCIVNDDLPTQANKYSNLVNLYGKWIAYLQP